MRPQPSTAIVMARKMNTRAVSDSQSASSLKKAAEIVLVLDLLLFGSAETDKFPRMSSDSLATEF